MALLLNQAGAQTPWLDVQLEGTRDNRLGLGARVAIWRAGRAVRWRRAHTDGSYLSASSPRVHFGLGDGPVDGVLVAWPTGARELWKRPMRGAVRLRQGSGESSAR